MDPASGVADRPSWRVVSDNPERAGSKPNHQDASRSVSGGFLLKPLPRAPKRKPATSHGLDHSERSVAPPHTAQDSQHNPPSLPSHEPAESSKPPSNTGVLDRLPVFKRQKGKQKKHEAADSPSPRISNASSPMQSSSTSATAAAPSSSQTEEAASDAMPVPQPAIDPAQIVRMALSLNESRRMSLSPGRLAAASPSLGARRVTSVATPPPPQQSSIQANLGDYREALRQSLEPRSTTPNTSNASRLSPSPQLRATHFDQPDVQGTPQSLNLLDQQYAMSFSAATISRAEKARNFIELHDQYRRLLQFLPPLRPNRRAGEPQALGREYNPLQHIRNRKLRGREQGLLDPEGAGWNDLGTVVDWVDSVETNAASSNYRKGDMVKLPHWTKSSSDKVQDQDVEAAPFDTSNQNTKTTKTKMPKLDWAITPAGFFADAYWLEQGRNKGRIETREGDKVFPQLRQPRNQKGLDSSRVSYESNRDFSDDAFSSPDPQIEQSPDSLRNRTYSPEDISTSEMPDSSPSAKNTGSGKRGFLRRRKDPSRLTSHSDDSDNESMGKRQKVSLGRKLGVNIGPLEKHMISMLKGESSAEVALDALQPTSITREQGQQRRGGMSSDRPEGGNSTQETPQQWSANAANSRDVRTSFGSDHPDTPRISVDDFDSNQNEANGSPAGPSVQSPIDRIRSDNTKTKPRTRRFSLFHKHSKSKELNKVEEVDFAVAAKDSSQGPPVEAKTASEPSLKSASRTNSIKNLSSPAHSRRQSSSKSHEGDVLDDKESNSAGIATRFFKAGRIGELVRGELGHYSEPSSKRAVHRIDSIPSSRTETASTHSDSENNDDEDGLYLSVHDGNHRRSRSTNDLNKPHSYDSRILPTFRSAHAPPLTEGLRPTTSSGEDHISRQMKQQRDRHTQSRSRLGRLSPLNIETSPNISPNTSFTNLTTQNTNNQSNKTGHSEAQYSSNYSSSAISAGDRLNKVLREPGGVGKGGLPVTGLSRVDPTARAGSRRAAGQHPGSPAEEDKGYDDAQELEEPAVTERDIQRIKALLLSSGVKAQAIVRRANSTQETPSKFLLDAAATASITVSPQTKRKEHVVAARILSSNLEDAAASFEKIASDFRNQTCQSLHAQLDDLRDRANSDLTLRIQSCVDDADGFVGRLTTTHTLAVQQVNDSVDRMIRTRWRRLRWLSRAGFKMLEWLLVGLMWFIWAFVWALKIARGLVVGVVSCVRWLLGI